MAAGPVSARGRYASRDYRWLPPAGCLWVRNAFDGSLIVLHPGEHTLVAGRTGAGKSILLRQLIRNAIPDIADGCVRAFGVDLKDGVELDRWSPWMQIADNLDATIAVLEQVDRERGERNTLLREQGSDKVEVSRDLPLIALIVDELAELAGGVDKNTRSQQERARFLLDRILRLGRAAGITVVAASQDPRKERLPVRDAFPNRIALALNSREEATMLMGEDAVRDGCAPHAIPSSTPGVGYWHDRARHRAVRFRCPYQPGL
ncbi:ATP-binding cassette domain-containing protein [Bifidobacterium pullorum subsp. saeculare]|nr:FtsK/SpoIIIE domain-containing protein [Bifidobacterium pullorum]MBM6691687.1 ATP-binding cassette domain-containing protein [Bifidobacterium pullorum subsp. saeculare]